MYVNCVSATKWTNKGEMLKYLELHELGYFSVVNGRNAGKKMKRKLLEKRVFEERVIF